MICHTTYDVIEKGDLEKVNEGHFNLRTNVVLPIYHLRKLMELYTESENDLHIVFINLEKAFERASYEVLWSCQDKKEVSGVYIRVIKDKYDGIKRVLRLQEET